MDAHIHLLPPAADVPSPTVTEAERLVDELCAQIDAIRERIPRVAMPHPTMARQARGARTVPREFIATMAATVDDVEELRALGTFDCDNARAMLQYGAAFRVFTDRVTLLLKTVNHTMEAWRADVAFEAMQTYAIAKGLARDPGNAHLVPRLSNLRRDLGRKNGADYANDQAVRADTSV